MRAKLPQRAEQSASAGNNPTAINLFSPDFFSASRPSPSSTAGACLSDTLSKMAKVTSDTRTTIEQAPFLIPDLTIKDLLSAIPYVHCWHVPTHQF